MATGIIKGNAAISIDVSSIQPAVSWITLADFRAYQIENIVHLFGCILVNNQTGSNYGNDSNITDFIVNFPFTASSGQYCYGMSNNVNISNQSNGLVRLRMSSNKLQLAYDFIKAGAVGRIWFETTIKIA